MTIKQIADTLGLSWGLEQYPCAQGCENIGYNVGCVPVLRAWQAVKLLAYLYSLPKARQISHLELAMNPFRHLTCSEHTIWAAFRRRGYGCYPACAKHCWARLIKKKRIEFTLSHHTWNLEDWSRALKTNETWATGTPHKSSWVTRIICADAYIVWQTPTYILGRQTDE